MLQEIKNIVKRVFPEIASGYHLPMLARIVSISDATNNTNNIDSTVICDNYRPYYAADIQLLNKRGQVEKGQPIFTSVPLPVSGIGLMRGTFALPEAGTLCEVAFAYGQPDQIFIRTILPYGHSLPSIKQGEHLQQNAPGVFEKTDRAGHKQRTTHGNITDTSTHHTTHTLNATLNACHSNNKISGHSTEEINGTKLIEAMGAIKLLSGGHFNIAAIDNLSLSTSRDQQITAGNNITERIGHTRDSLAKILQRVQVVDGGKIWLGNESHNVLQLLSDLMGIVEGLASDLANHKHLGVTAGSGVTQTPDITGKFTQAAEGVSGVKEQLDSIVK